MKKFKFISNIILFIWIFQNNNCAHAQIKKKFAGKYDYISNYNKSFNEHTWLVSHNSYSYDTVFSNQFGTTIQRQLNMGVRGLMLDLYEYNDTINLCHKVCKLSNGGTIIDLMNKIIIPFLDRNPHEIITIFLEDHTKRDKLNSALNKIKNLSKYTFNPQKWIEYTKWPTISEMIVKNQRLILVTENEENSGFFQTNSGEVHIIFGQDIFIENYWSLGKSILSHDYSCISRWQNIQLDEKTSSPFYFWWNRLFLMNHFHGIPFANHSEIDNSFENIFERDEKYCRPITQKKPNYIALDNISKGNGFEYIDILNNGGILFYELNENKELKILCGVGTSFKRNITFQEINCPAQRIQGAILKGVQKETIISLYNENNQKLTHIDIIEDIALDYQINIPSFDSYNFNPYYILKYAPRGVIKSNLNRVIIE